MSPNPTLVHTQGGVLETLFLRKIFCCNLILWRRTGIQNFPGLTGLSIPVHLKKVIFREACLKKLLVFPLITISLLWTQVFLSPEPVDARQGCCSHHGGVRGCSCADGTPLSDKCRPYYPHCANPNATPQVPAPSATPVRQIPASPGTAQKGQTLSGEVVGVSDGDTLTLLVGRTTYKIRLNAVDCPESKQAFGTQAKQFTSNMVFGKTVTVKVTDKDRYGRLVGDVLIGGKSLNQELLRAGMAWHYKQYSKDQELARLELEARSAKRGLWRDSNPTPPWDWRRQKRK